MLGKKSILVAGATAGGLGVALGAFGAHALKPLLEANGAVQPYSTAVQYQFYHALALLLIGALWNQFANEKGAGWAAFCMLTGTVLFSGSLYLLALTGTRSVVLVTPLGGVFFIAGWALFVVALLKSKKTI